jgi:predicted solute-binding protein
LTQLVQKKRLAVSNSIAVEPIIQGINRQFEVLFRQPVECANLLRSNQVEVALIPSIEYAKNVYEMDYRIFPEFCLTCTKDVNDSVLIFTPEEKNFSSIAFRPGIISEIVLAKIIFLENYNIEPSYIPSVESIEVLFKKADSILLIGNEAIENISKYNSYLNLYQDWYEITDLPFVSCLWVSKENMIESEEVANFQLLLNENIRSLLLLDSAQSKNNQDEQSKIMTYKGYGYKLGDVEKESLSEFFKFAFYYGMIEDVPDLKFIS